MRVATVLCVVLCLVTFALCSRANSQLRYKACRAGCVKKTNTCITKCLKTLEAVEQMSELGGSTTTGSKKTETTTTTVTVQCPSWWPSCNEDLGIPSDKKTPEPTVPEVPPKPVNPNFYRNFSINSIVENVDQNLANIYGGQFVAKAFPLSPEFADNVRDFSEYLNSYGRVAGSMSFHQSYAKFLDSLSMPENFNQTVESDPQLVAIQQQIVTARESLVQLEETCFAKYVGIIASRYSKEDFKQIFCRNIAAAESQIAVLQGTEYSKRRELQGQWSTLIEALPRYKSVAEANKGLWNKVKSVKQFQSTASSGGNQFSVKIGRTITPTAGVGSSDAPQKKFLQAETVAYEFPRENVTFYFEIGAKSFANFVVRPNSEWFNAALFNTYKNGPFKAPATSDYFFGASGVTKPQLKSFTLVMEPYVTMTVDKSVKEFIEQKKKVTITNIPFDLNTDSELIAVESEVFEGVYTVTLKRTSSTPLVVSHEL